MINESKRRYDWVTILLYVVILIFGWVNIYAAVYDDAHSHILDFSVQHGKELIWIGVSAILAVAILLVEPRLFSTTAYFIYGIMMVLLVVTLFVATVTKGGQSWIDFGAFKFQPSEFAKFATALALAKYMSAIDLDTKKLRTKLIIAAIIGIPAVLILLQHDTGSALVFASFLIPLYREGLSGKVFLVGLLAVALFIMALLINKYIVLGIVAAMCLVYLFVWLSKRGSKEYVNTALFFIACAVFIFSVDFGFNKILQPHQRERIDVLLGKTEDLKGSGYNVHQAKIAIGSGEFLGKGFLRGTITKADFVPEQETDFIFCTVGEEWGFVGCTALIGLYMLLLCRLVMIAERQRSLFARFYGYSVASILFIHIFINIGMVIGLLPVIGIPLPFMSYGGSSLLAFTILLFIFIRQDAERTKLI